MVAVALAKILVRVVPHNAATRARGIAKVLAPVNVPIHQVK